MEKLFQFGAYGNVLVADFEYSFPVKGANGYLLLLILIFFPYSRYRMFSKLWIDFCPNFKRLQSNQFGLNTQGGGQKKLSLLVLFYFLLECSSMILEPQNML